MTGTTRGCVFGVKHYMIFPISHFSLVGQKGKGAKKRVTLGNSTHSHGTTADEGRHSDIIIFSTFFYFLLYLIADDGCH